MNGKKGFFISIVTLALALSLAAFAVRSYDAQVQLDRQLVGSLPGETAGYAFDDVEGDINEMTGINFALARNSTHLNASFGGQLGMQRNMSEEILNYGAFAARYYSKWTGADLALDLSSIADGSVEVVLSNGLMYALDNESAAFWTVDAAGATNATRYEIVVSVDRYRADVVPWIPTGGDMQVVLHYSDRNGTISETVSLNPTLSNAYLIQYGGLDMLAIAVGQVGGRSGALAIGKFSNVTAVFSVNATTYYALPDGVRSYWPVALNYSQGGVERSSLIEGEMV